MTTIKLLWLVNGLLLFSYHSYKLKSSNSYRPEWYSHYTSGIFSGDHLRIELNMLTLYKVDTMDWSIKLDHLNITTQSRKCTTFRLNTPIYCWPERCYHYTFCSGILLRGSLDIRNKYDVTLYKANAMIWNTKLDHLELI